MLGFEIRKILDFENPTFTRTITRPKMIENLVKKWVIVG